MNVVSSVFDKIVGFAMPFWVKGKRDPSQGNRFFYDSGTSVVPVGQTNYIIHDDTMSRQAEECVTFKADKKHINTYRANSAICAQKKAVFCMIDKTHSTTEASTTTTSTPLTTVKPDIPGENLPKMPRFCPPKRRKRSPIGK